MYNRDRLYTVINTHVNHTLCSLRVATCGETPGAGNLSQFCQLNNILKFLELLNLQV